MNTIEQGFEELLGVNAEMLGEPQYVFVNGTKHEALIEEIGSAEAAISGGMTEVEQFRVKVRKKEFSSLPEKGDPVRVRGRDLEIVGPVTDRNGVELELTVGDLTGGES